MIEATNAYAPKLSILIGRSSIPGAGADQRRKAVVGVVGDLLHRRIPAEPVEPAIAMPRGQEARRHRRVADRVDAEAVLPDHLPQRSVEQHTERLHQPFGALATDAGRGTHGAAGTVGPDHIVGQHGPAGTGFKITEPDRGGVLILLHLLDDLFEPDLRRGQFAQVVEQHRLQMILRYTGRRGRTEYRTLLGCGVADLDGLTGGGLGQRRRGEHLPDDVVAAGAYPVHDPQERNSSMERRLTTVARGWIDRVRRRSMTRQRMSARARVIAAVRPAGPAPTMTTGQRSWSVVMEAAIRISNLRRTYCISKDSM